MNSVPVAAWLGLGLVALGLSWTGEPSHTAPNNLERSHIIRLDAYFGSPDLSYTSSLEIDARHIVAVFSEFREGDDEVKGHYGRTRILVWTNSVSFEGFWVRQSVREVVSQVGEARFVRVHVPTGATIHRGTIPDEASTEVVPVLIQKSNIEFVGPSSVARFRDGNRRPMAAVYCRGRIVLELHDDLEGLKSRLGPDQP